MPVHENMLRFAYVVTTIALVAIVVPILSSGVPTTNNEKDSQTGGQADIKPASARDKFELKKVLNFSFYKQLFNKSYTSISEELVRQKLFWARALRAFVSGFSYKTRKTSHYLALNQMSDWTASELDSLRNSFIAEEVPIGAKLAKSRTNLRLQEQHDDSSNKVSSCHRPREFSPEKIINRPIPTEPEQETDVKEGSVNTGRHSWKIPLSNYHLVWVWPHSKGPNTKGVQDAAEVTDNSDEDAMCSMQDRDELYVDHSKSGCMNEVQNQGTCGSCYIFASLAFFEWSICKETNELYKFSEQFIVDCGPETEYGQAGHLKACSGGKTTYVAKYLTKYGVELLRDYAYKEQNGQCPYDDVQKKHKQMGKFRFTHQAAETYYIHVSQFKDYIPFTPIMVDIDTRGGFEEYGGGVHIPTSCCKGLDPGKCAQHSVVIVGYGREDGEEYWLMRNSYAISWGEEGHYKLSTKASDCIDPQYGRVHGTDDGVNHRYKLKSNKRRPEWIQERINNTERYKKEPSRIDSKFPLEPDDE